jgi:hypothetical protein
MSTLPDPPNGHTRWSIVTLAVWLCVPTHVVDALLTVDPTLEPGDSPDFHSPRGWEDGVGAHSYRTPDGGDYGDVWLHDEAAERIAAALPAAQLARLILADPAGVDGQVHRIGGPALLALAQHVVTHGGSAG